MQHHDYMHSGLHPSTILRLENYSTIYARKLIIGGLTQLDKDLI